VVLSSLPLSLCCLPACVYLPPLLFCLGGSRRTADYLDHFLGLRCGDSVPALC